MYRLLISFGLAIIAAQPLSAQDIQVDYDAFYDTICYKQMGVRIDRPVVRKGNRVILNIKNYNSYLYRISVKTTKSQLPVAQGTGFGGIEKLLTGKDKPISFVFGIDSSTEKEAIPKRINEEQTSGFTPQEKDNRQKTIQEMKDLLADFSKTNDLVKSLDLRLQRLQQEMQTTLNAHQAQLAAVDELQQLPYNPKINPDQIKKLAGKYMTFLFDEADPEKIKLARVFQKGDSLYQATQQLKQQYDNKTEDYTQYANALKEKSIALKNTKYSLKETNIDEFRSASEAYATSTMKKLALYRANSTMLDTTISKVKRLDPKILAQLYTNYQILLKNDFIASHSETADSDDMSLQLVFTPLDSVKIPGVSTKSVPPIKASTYGGLQIKGGLGLGFGQFCRRPLNYFVKDSIIGSSKKDAFTPFLISFVHFYKQGRTNTSFGGSFGLGIPLGGSNTLESLAFFFGPSMIVGRQERIVFNGGLMGSKVSRLADGYKVGGSFKADPTLLKTEAKYALGYFFSVSFNLIGTKN